MLQAQGDGPVLLAGDQPLDAKPKRQGLAGPLEDRPRGH